MMGIIANLPGPLRVKSDSKCLSSLFRLSFSLKLTVLLGTYLHGNSFFQVVALNNLLFLVMVDNAINTARGRTRTRCRITVTPLICVSQHVFFSFSTVLLNFNSVVLTTERRHTATHTCCSISPPSCTDCWG